MSSQGRNDRRDSSRSRVVQQWVPRGSPISLDSRANELSNVGNSVAPKAPFVQGQNDRLRKLNEQRDGVGSSNLNVASRDNKGKGCRGRPPSHRKGRETVEKDQQKQLVRVDEDVPQRVQEIQDKLIKGSVECMICCDRIRRTAPIWSCSSCCAILHLTCTKKWACAPTSSDLDAEKSQGLNWRCPLCQSVQLTASKEIRYVCFCGKRHDPPSDFYLTPHSCGEPCGKPLDISKDVLCPHVCVLQCHPGPCPPCKAFAPPRMCPCGKEMITTRCSDQKAVLTCGQICEKNLECQRHKCEKICHLGPCDPCRLNLSASCFCMKKTESILCGEIAVKGEVDVDMGLFSCDSSCEKKLGCGNHFCGEVCHPGSCGECELLPSKIKTCHCGKTFLQDKRSSCLDPIPTCTKICSKLLPCRKHSCTGVCHEGDCSPCLELVSQKCRCGSTSRIVECYKSTSADEKFVCEKPCGKKKNCGRHRCSERCCPPINSDSNPHVCSIVCGKKLRCGQHSCQSPCHSGHCTPCYETIFNDLTCTCGRTSLPPPLPCGTPRPSCQYPCSVPQPCGHQSSHSCHLGDCPPCPVSVAKECVGGHVVLRNIPCGSKEIKCNKLCGKTRQCGIHACGRVCHTQPCDSSTGLNTSCGQKCGAPRRDCRHTCNSLCHPSTPCPDLRCESPVTITCSCGRITESVPCCDSGGSEKKKLTCDDECVKAERRRVLADAFDITPPNLEAVSEDLREFFRRDPNWVTSVQERLKYLVMGKGRVGSHMKVHVFSPMLKEKRDALRLIAESWKVTVNLVGWEPKRFVVVHVTPKSKPPARIIGGKTGSGISTAPTFDPLVDMNPRLVVGLFDLPSDADISALVLRFGGECELVWLNAKNAIAVFNDPARAATAMRRLDRGSVYHGAAVIQRAGSEIGSTSGANDWRGVVKANNNPWKKAVMKESNWGDDLWGEEEWSNNGGEDSAQDLKIGASNATVSMTAMESSELSSRDEVADDWEKAYG